jgi:2-iminobutanoate/2-iminopropanoate deaminase
MVTGVPQPEGTFSEAVIVDSRADGRWIHVAGQVAPPERDGAGDSAFEAEARHCFGKLASALNHCGAGLSDVVKITAYLTSLDDYSAFASARGAAFGDALPASTAVGVAALLAGARVEVDAVAFLPD